MDTEATVVVAVAALVGLPLVLALSARAPGLVRTAGIALWLGLAVVVWTKVSFRPLPTPEAEVVDRPTRVTVDGYVSSDSCRACHPEQYGSWKDSYHRTMTQVTTPSTVLGDFSIGSLAWGAHSWSVERRGDGFFVRDDAASRGSGADAAADADWRRLVLSTGSHHMQLYWYSELGTKALGMFPFVWLREEQRWIPRGAAFIRPPNTHPDEGGRWNAECIQCHATHGQPGLMADGSVQTRVAEFGIGCEACHGPAKEHIATYRDPRARWERYGHRKPDKTIMDPGRLGFDRSSELCGQCHALAAYEVAGPERNFRTAGFSFQPGDDLADTRIVLGPDLDDAVREDLAASQPQLFAGSLWKDDIIRVSGRELNGLRVSPCYAHGTTADGEPRRAISCQDCHKVHQEPADDRPAEEWADDQLGLNMRTDEACLLCHDEQRGKEAEHSRHAGPDGGSAVACYDCHMPYTVYGLLKAVRQHQVSTPTVAESLEAGRPNACNGCHVDKSLGWAAAELHEWTGSPVPTLTEDEATVPATALWLLSGDAGQRALAAWSVGWSEAQAAATAGTGAATAGTGAATGDGGDVDWLAPVLAPILEDPYPAVRLVASRALRQLPGYEDSPYDPLGTPEELAAARQALEARWAAQGGSVLDPLDADTIERLLSQRDDRPVYLLE